MQKRILATAVLAALSSTSQADILGFRIGGYFWLQDYDGTVQSSNLQADRISIGRDLGIDDDNGGVFYVALEHPIPLLPNVMLQHSTVKVKTSNLLTRGFEFDDVTYSASETVITEGNLSHTDATLYYEILDNWVSLDLGLTLRYFGSGVKLRSASSGVGELELDTAIPMVFLAAKGELPLTGFFAKAEANGISYGDGEFLDYRVSLGYETNVGIGMELGFRRFDMDYEDGKEEANLTIDGGYAGIYYHF